MFKKVITFFIIKDVSIADPKTEDEINFERKLTS